MPSFLASFSTHAVPAHRRISTRLAAQGLLAPNYSLRRTQAGASPLARFEFGRAPVEELQAAEKRRRAPAAAAAAPVRSQRAALAAARAYGASGGGGAAAGGAEGAGEAR